MASREEKYTHSVSIVRRRWFNGEDTSPDGVNRDVASVNKEIYDVDRQQGNIDLTVDYRLLSEDGRKQIEEDAKRTEIMGESIIDTVASRFRSFAFVLAVGFFFGMLFVGDWQKIKKKNSDIFPAQLSGFNFNRGNTLLTHKKTTLRKEKNAVSGNSAYMFIHC